MTSLSGKVFIVTGAASGIGLATAKLLASRGAKVSIADLTPNLEEVAESIKKSTGNENVIAFKVDVRDALAVSSWIASTVERFGSLDGAANIAGVYRTSEGATIADEDENNWQNTLNVNLTGVMYCLKAEVPHINKGGSIVNAASILANRGWAGGAAYSSSKHGVVGLTKSVAKEVGKLGIRVNCIAPGYINTPMLSSATKDPNKVASNDSGPVATPLGRMGEPEEVATLVAFLLSSEASYITGACINIDGGMSA